MGKDGFVILICIGGIGFLLLAIGILVRTGIWRSVYATQGYPVYIPRELASTGIFVALTVLSLWLILILPLAKETRGNLIMYVSIPMSIITYILAIWQPWWLKPKWLRWLEEEHSNIIDLLWEDVRKDKWGWERKVRTQEDLEEWVNEVRRKHELM